MKSRSLSLLVGSVHLNPQFLPLAVFAAASVLGVALLGARVLATGSTSHLYLPWNLFLAWIPLGFALLARRLAQSTPPRPWATAACGLGWLLFLPNAPYIFTDLMHLARRSPTAVAPLWYDLFLHLIVAMTGLCLGFASLAIVQGLLARKWGRPAGWLFAVAALALCGFGIYLGRCLRWNSWDLLIDPVAVLTDIAERLLDPWSHPRAYGFTLLSFLFLLAGYLMCYTLPALITRTEQTARS